MDENKKLPIEEIEDALSDNYDGDELEVYNDYDGDADVEEYFDGEAADEELEVYENYDGEEDEMLDFHGPKITKENLRASTKRETFSIENTTDKQLVVAINPASFPTVRVAIVKDDNGTPKYKELGGAMLEAKGLSEGDAIVKYNNPDELRKAGLTVDTVLDDGIVYAEDAEHYLKITAAKPEGAIRHWLNYIKHHPVFISALHITSDNTALFESGIELKRIKPYFIFGEERIPFQDAFKPQNYNVQKIVVERNFKLDANTVAIFTIPARTKATFTFVVGAEADLGKALVSKVKRAIENKPVRRWFRLRRRRRFGRPLRRRWFHRHRH